VTIKTGSSGTTQDNWLMTDTYRRTLVSLLPASHPVRQEVEAGTSDLFGPTPANYTATGGIEQFIASERTGVGSYTTYQQPAMATADMIQRLQAGETPVWLQPARDGTGEHPYRNWSPSPLFRQPGELELSPEQRAQYIAVLQSMLPPAGPSRVLNSEGSYVEAPPVDPTTYWQNYIPEEDPTYYFGPGGFNLSTGGGG